MISENLDISAEQKESDDEDDDFRLQITITPEKEILEELNDEQKDLEQNKEIKINKRKLCELYEDDDEPWIDIGLEKKLRECARRKNLSSAEMKMLLKKIVSNDHILALVKLQDDEITKINTRSCSNHKEEERVLKDDNIATLTRSKARALKKNPIPINPMIKPELKPEVVALVSSELNSDDEDEEYKPHEEDFVSDDDPNTTVSDIESQPRTPQTPLSQNEYEESPIKYSNDGLFKVPNENCVLKIQQEEIIAKRTRSKLCLQTTPIEIIESTFIPPDIPGDMCYTVVDVDPAWQNFLSEFSKPLNSTAEEDDEADPEYIANDTIPIDSEELRDVNISKKELNDLVNELFDGLISEGVNIEDISLHDSLRKSQEKTHVKKKEKLTTGDQSQFQDNLGTEKDCLNQTQVSMCNNQCDIANDSGSNNLGKSYNIIQEAINKACIDSPPKTLHLQTPSNPLNIISQSSTDNSYNNANLGSIGTDQQAFSLQLPQQLETFYQYSNDSIALNQSINSTNFSNASASDHSTFVQCPAQIILLNNGGSTNIPHDANSTFQQQTPLIAYQIILPPLPSSQSILQKAGFNNNQLTQANSVISNNSNYYTTAKHMEQIEIIDLTNDDSGVKIKPKKNVSKHFSYELHKKYHPFELKSYGRYSSIDKTIKKEYMQKYEHLRYIEPENIKYDENEKGFKDSQLKIFQQQMRISVQFAVQNFFQTFCHPELWKFANAQKKILLDLAEKCDGNDKSFFNSWNLKHALELVVEWEKELSECNETNKALMEFWNTEILRAKMHKNCNSSYVMKFPPRIMKRLLTSSAIMYPHLLPRIPFRMDIKLGLNRMLPSEDHLIAYGLEYYTKLFQDQKNKSKRCKRVNFNLTKILDAISKNLLIGKSRMQIYTYIRRRSKEDTYNPIKYYFDHKKAPPFVHTLYSVNLDCIATPKDSPSELPAIWLEFHDRLKAVELEKSCNPRKYAKSLNAICELDQEKITLDPKTCAYEFSSTSDEFRNSQTNIIINLNYVPPDELVEQEQNILPLYDEILLQERHKKYELNSSKNWILLRSYRQFRRKQYFYNIRKLNLKRKRILKLFLNIKLCRNWKIKFAALISHFRAKINFERRKYKNSIIQNVYLQLRTLELYTKMLKALKMNIKRVKGTTTCEENVHKRPKSNEDEPNKTKKPNKGLDNLRQMLLHENYDIVNEKDAIYAYNYFERVEEIFRSSGKIDELKKFHKILKSFNPQTDNAANLYFKLEKIFLPDHEDLAEIFLTFLLPNEAAEIGKFFEHFMINNMGNFVNKLNIHFNKQPAQIRKIYNLLNDFVNDSDVTVEKIKSKILPLLKGNQFLIDWFVQTFPSETPPESLMSSYETVSLKHIETAAEADMWEDIPLKELYQDEPDNNFCQIKFINGRIFYGSKILLPAKLSFLAQNCYTKQKDSLDDLTTIEETSQCVHEIRDYAEKRLSSYMENPENGESLKECNGEDKDNDKYVLCDDVTLKAHAVRLNPSFYASKLSNHGDLNQLLKPKIVDMESKSPKKQNSKTINSNKERRKSPKKNFLKPPVGKKVSNQTNNLIECNNSDETSSNIKKTKLAIDEMSENDIFKNKKKQKGNVKTSIVEQASDDTKKKTSSAIWTRDEDKIILEEVKAGYGSSEVLISRLKIKLEDKSRDEIIARHKFLMDLLLKLQRKA